MGMVSDFQSIRKEVIMGRGEKDKPVMVRWIYDLWRKNMSPGGRREGDILYSHIFEKGNANKLVRLMSSDKKSYFLELQAEPGLKSAALQTLKNLDGENEGVISDE